MFEREIFEESVREGTAKGREPGGENYCKIDEGWDKNIANDFLYSSVKVVCVPLGGPNTKLQQKAVNFIYFAH